MPDINYVAPPAKAKRLFYTFVQTLIRNSGPKEVKSNALAGLLNSIDKFKYVTRNPFICKEHSEVAKWCFGSEYKRGE